MTVALAVLTLATVYVLVVGSAAAADLATALGLAVVVRGALTRFLRRTAERGPAATSSLARRLAGVPWFVAGTVLEITRGTFEVAAVVLGRPTRPGLIDVPLEARTPAGIVAGTLALTLSPGSVVVEVDEARRRLRLHVIDARDPDAVRSRMRDFYRRYQRAVFP